MSDYLVQFVLFLLVLLVTIIPSIILIRIMNFMFFWTCKLCYALADICLYYYEARQDGEWNI